MSRHVRIPVGPLTWTVTCVGLRAYNIIMIYEHAFSITVMWWLLETKYLAMFFRNTSSKINYVFCLRRSRIRKGRAREKTWTRDGQFSSRVRFNSTKLFWISRVMKIDNPEFTFFPNCEPWVNTASEQMRFLYEETIFKCWWGNNLFPKGNNLCPGIDTK